MRVHHGRTLPRFFVEGVRRLGDVVALGGGDARKLTAVLRRGPGAEIEICDSAGQSFKGRLTADGGRLSAVLVERRDAPPAPGIAITLAQAIPKGAKMDFVVEKGTELGVARIVPLLTERTLGEGGDAKVLRWRRLARTASAQCGRTRVPSIDSPVRLAAFLAARPAAPILVPWELAERVPLRERLPELLDRAAQLTVIIGPEGGFSHAEVERASAAGAAIVSLGARILRTETAGLAVLSAILYAAGEF